LPLKAMGRKPSEATAAVISTGRSRVRVPFNTRSFRSLMPSFSSWSKVAMRTMPLSTATPKSAMKPTPALMLNGMPRAMSASTPPMALMGMAV